MTLTQPAVVRKSTCIDSLSGCRKEVPLSSQLQTLSAELRSGEQPAVQSSWLCEAAEADSPASAGPSRSKTPVGSAAPLTRRSISAKMTPTGSIHQDAHPQPQQYGYLPEDDSLVLYKDASELSTQESMASVVSGRFQEGDTFYTALKKDLSFQSACESPAPQAMTAAASFLSSQLNPVQSPSSSAYFPAAGDAGSDEDAAGAEDSLQDEYSRAANLAASESSYAAMSAEASGLPADTLQSVMYVISSLYCSQSPGAVQQQRPTPWQQDMDQHGLSLMAAGAAAAAAAKPQSEAAAASPPAAAAVSPGIAEGSAQAEASVAADTATFQLPTSNDSILALVTDQEQVAAAEEGRSTTAATSMTDAEGPAAFDDDLDGDVDRSSDRAQADSSAYLAQVEQLLVAHSRVHAELSSYIDQLTSLADDDGQKLVELPADYALMVERRLCECRTEYQALQGWEGPHRFSDLPIALLPATHDNPEIAAGLAVIRQLDDQLKEVWLKSLVSARGSNPEQWAEAERRHLERRASQLDEALARERQRRLHAARLLRALHKLEGQQQGQGDEQSQADLLLGPGKGLSSYSYYRLQARDEQVLAAVLGRDEAELEQSNPFDASTACLECDAADGAATPPQSSFHPGSADDAGHGDPAGAAEAATACTGLGASGRSSSNSSGSALSRLTSSSRPSRTLAEINSQLEALHACGSQRQDDSSSRSTCKGSGSVSSKRTSLCSASSSAVQGSNTTVSQPDGNNHASSSSQAKQQRDFIREQREARELAQRELEVDAKLRALRTSELPSQLLPKQLAALLHEASGALPHPGLAGAVTAHGAGSIAAACQESKQLRHRGESY